MAFPGSSADMKGLADVKPELVEGAEAVRTGSLIKSCWFFIQPGHEKKTSHGGTETAEAKLNHIFKLPA